MSINLGAHTRVHMAAEKRYETKDEKLGQHREGGSWGYTGNQTTRSRQHAVDPLSSACKGLSYGSKAGWSPQDQAKEQFTRKEFSSLDLRTVM